MPAAPVRVPRKRPSIAPDDIAHLTLSEVRERLARNERVLNSALLSTSPGLSTSPLAGMSSFPSAAAAGATGLPSGLAASGLASSPSPRFGTSPTSSVNGGSPDMRSRLLAVRDALRAREAELVADEVGNMSLADRRPSASLRSGKARALDAIRMEEAAHPRNPISLPMETSLALGTRDYDNLTAARFAALGLSPSASPASSRAPSYPGMSRGGLHAHEGDALARAARAASYAKAHADDDDDMFGSPDEYAAASVYASERHDLGNGLPLATARARRAEGLDGDMRLESTEEGADDAFGEDNDEYDEDARGVFVPAGEPLGEPVGGPLM